MCNCTIRKSNESQEFSFPDRDREFLGLIWVLNGVTPVLRDWLTNPGNGIEFQVPGIVSPGRIPNIILYVLMVKKTCTVVKCIWPYNEIGKHLLIMLIMLIMHVGDCSLVYVLLDEIVGSTIHRCLDPVTMEPSVSLSSCLCFVLLTYLLTVADLTALMSHLISPMKMSSQIAPLY